MKQLFLILSLIISMAVSAQEKTPCKGTTTKNLPCKSTMIMKDGYCRMHSPNAIRCDANTSKKTPCKMVVNKVGEKCKHHNK